MTGSLKFYQPPALRIPFLLCLLEPRDLKVVSAPTWCSFVVVSGGGAWHEGDWIDKDVCGRAGRDNEGSTVDGRTTGGRPRAVIRVDEGSAPRDKYCPRIHSNTDHAELCNQATPHL